MTQPDKQVVQPPVQPPVHEEPVAPPMATARVATARTTTVRRHHWFVRLTHWVNVVALGVMVGSGLQIFNAYPRFNRRGATFCCYPFAGHAIPRWATFGRWLAGARNWHFAMMWVFVLNGLAYVLFVWFHGEWRDLVPRRGDPRDAWEMVKFYLFVRRHHPHQGKHNALQKFTYTAIPVLAVLAVITGLAIWKPVSLGWLTAALGGFALARYWHFLVMAALVALATIHVFMVLTVDPYSIRSMLTGKYNSLRSPELRDGRPLYHLFTRPRSAAARSPDAAA